MPNMFCNVLLQHVWNGLNIGESFSESNSVCYSLLQGLKDEVDEQKIRASLKFLLERKKTNIYSKNI